MRLTIVILAATALAAGPAAAKPKKNARVYERERATPSVCRPMCTTDMTPCDPPEFKRADGRCASPVTGGSQP